MFSVVVTASHCDDSLGEFILDCNAARLPNLLSMLQDSSWQFQFACRHQQHSSCACFLYLQPFFAAPQTLCAYDADVQVQGGGPSAQVRMEWTIVQPGCKYWGISVQLCHQLATAPLACPGNAGCTYMHQEPLQEQQ
jgi:hypothetical protein